MSKTDVVFVSNYINHHQIPFCNEMARLCEGGFRFMATEPMSEERKAMGWDEKDIPDYVINYGDNPEGSARLLMEAGAVIFGGARDEELIILRLEAGKFTIRYSESIYKTGRWKFISPRGLIKKYHDHTRFRKSPCYLLCAGAYVPGDFKLIGAYPGKMFKFGYFPETVTYGNVHELRSGKKNAGIDILWAGRFIDWKHPEVMLELARNLSELNIDYKITMVGNGELLEKYRCMADEQGLNGRVFWLGAMKPGEVRELMLKADMFVATSDRNEGWGAVLNEAMNSGAAVIAPRDMGAAPWLIEHGVNGMLYPACNIKKLTEAVVRLASSEELRRGLGTAAYETIVNTWNARVAAGRLYDFIADPDHVMKDYEDGPMSKL